ncbi:hypothetical protein J7T55_008968 [Diaporthe amygdali]|uniref:uncharacterized protein n=1 Tax=Phomopsis amygdali TaxID=1214568 RepID=UPI0022FE9685|nr:uncharacterized protein J7T55_008968 [Diaporthe amygdali]KAJ0100707.1 hypothetical protein J7T55_008968 [Diaporthe amygdali]
MTVNQLGATFKSPGINPIGTGLDAFRASFSPICEDKSISCTPDALDQFAREELQNLTLDLILALHGLRTSRVLSSRGGGKNVFSDLSKLKFQHGNLLSSQVVESLFMVSCFWPRIVPATRRIANEKYPAVGTNESSLRRELKIL